MSSASRALLLSWRVHHMANFLSCQSLDLLGLESILICRLCSIRSALSLSLQLRQISTIMSMCLLLFYAKYNCLADKIMFYSFFCSWIQHPLFDHLWVHVHVQFTYILSVLKMKHTGIVMSPIIFPDFVLKKFLVICIC